MQHETRNQKTNVTPVDIYNIESPLRPIQLSAKVSGALHELLVLLLLHLELSLSLDADGVHVATSPDSVGSELSLGHASQKAARLLIVDDARAVRNYANLAVRFG